MDQTEVAWRSVLTDEVIVKINTEGFRKQLREPFTLVVVTKEECDVFVSRYYPKQGDPFQRVKHMTKGGLVQQPARVFLFDGNSDRPAVRGEIVTENGQPTVNWL